MTRLGIAIAECAGYGEGDLLARIDKLPAKPAYVPIWCTWGDHRTGPPGETFPTDLVEGLRSRGITPAIFWQPWNGADSHVNILRGRWDGYLDAWARDAAAWGGPVLVRLAHEQNGNWFKWSPGGSVKEPNPTNTAQSYVEMWRYVVARVGPVAPRVMFWWCPNVKPTASIADTWPGDEWVSRAGFDGYGWKDPLPAAEDIYGPALAAIRALTAKPIIVGEFGVAAGTTGRRAWFTDTMSWFDDHDIAGAIYFSLDTRTVDPAKPEPDWRLSSKASILPLWASEAA